MNSNLNEEDIDLVLDSYGNIDREYYLNKAYDLRHEYLSAMFRSAKNSIYKAVLAAAEKLFCKNCQPSH